ncbi:MAG TPA: hypothetical protein VHS34_04710 [Terriglobales bacterium]|nr:hypothetical protein [Terriglobales bacterium]
MRSRCSAQGGTSVSCLRDGAYRPVSIAFFFVSAVALPGARGGPGSAFDSITRRNPSLTAHVLQSTIRMPAAKL